MRFHGIGAALLGSPARTATLTALLASVDLELTGRELARRAGISPPRALEALRRLEAEGICFRRSVGAADLWQVDRRHFLANALSTLGSLDAAARRALVDVLASYLREADEAYVFGSLTTGHERPTSDIDVLVVFSNEGEKARWERSLEDLQDRIQGLFANQLQVVAYTPRDLRREGARRLLARARQTGWRVGGAR